MSKDEDDNVVQFILIGFILGAILMGVIAFSSPNMISKEARDAVCVESFGDNYENVNGEFGTDSKFYCKDISKEKALIVEVD